MEQSESIQKLMGALLTAQEDMGHAEATTKGQYDRLYSSLTEVLDAVKPHLRKAGIALLQAPAQSDREFGCDTLLYHVESAEWIKARLVFPLPDSNPQRAGSALTYAKRYSITALCGISSESEDDDAAKASAAFGRGTPGSKSVRQMAIEEGGIEQPTLSDPELLDYSNAMIECIEADNKKGFLEYRGQLDDANYTHIYHTWTAAKRGKADFWTGKRK